MSYDGASPIYQTSFFRGRPFVEIVGRAARQRAALARLTGENMTLDPQLRVRACACCGSRLRVHSYWSDYESAEDVKHYIALCDQLDSASPLMRPVIEALLPHLHFKVWHRLHGWTLAHVETRPDCPWWVGEDETMKDHPRYLQDAIDAETLGACLQRGALASRHAADVYTYTEGGRPRGGIVLRPSTGVDTLAQRIVDSGVRSTDVLLASGTVRTAARTDLLSLPLMERNSGRAASNRARLRMAAHLRAAAASGDESEMRAFCLPAPAVLLQKTQAILLHTAPATAYNWNPRDEMMLTMDFEQGAMVMSFGLGGQTLGSRSVAGRYNEIAAGRQ